LTDRRRFEQQVLPHIDAAFNLARWLTRNDHDAEDVVQEAMLRAFRHFESLRGEARPWLLAIVRNACFSWIQRNRPAEVTAGLDGEAAEVASAPADGPEALLARELDRRKREDLLHQIQRLLHDKSVFAPIWENGFIRGVGSRVAEPALALIPFHPYSAPYEDVRLKP